MKEKVPFEELKAKAEGIFGRTLSDKEVAEVAINRLSELDDDNLELHDTIDGLREDIANLRQELSEQVQYDGVVKLVAGKLQEIVSTKAKAYTIKIKLDKVCVPTIDYLVEDEPLMMEEEEYE